MLPISRCNSAGFRLLLILALLITTSLALTPSPLPLQESVNDKLAHTAAFLLLSFLAHASWPDRTFHWKPMLLLISYGVALEFIQYFIPNRFFSLLDVLADLAGILLYLLLIPLVAWLLQSISNNQQKPS